MEHFRILNLEVTTKASIDINIEEINKTFNDFYDAKNFIITTNFTNDRFLSLFYSSKYKQIGILILENFGTCIVDKIFLSDKEYNLFKLSLQLLLTRLKHKQYDYSDTRDITKAWLNKLGETETLHKLLLSTYYKQNKLLFDKQVVADAENITENICESHNIEITNYVERAYLFRVLNGDLPTPLTLKK